LSSLKTLVGNESIVAECSGVNYEVYVTPSRVLVGKRFALGENYVDIPHSNVNTLELITKSVLPPLTFAILAGVGALLAWWLPGGALGVPSFPYNVILLGTSVTGLAALLALLWRRRVAVLRIGIVGSQPITVKMVSTSKAEDVFRALKD
jgi:hypothetical protein